MTEFICVILGVCLGALLSGMCLIYIPNSVYNLHENEVSKIIKCEEGIPRNQKCILIAIPERSYERPMDN